MTVLDDIQSQQDHRGIGIEQVGVSGLRYPITVFDPEQGKQHTIATISLSIGLSPEQKGGHLSRFIEILDAHAGELSYERVPIILGVLRERLESTSARIETSFLYFLRRFAPVTGASALVDYPCGLSASIHGSEVRMSLNVRVPVTSVCPCSKAISDYGAHNQRGYITIDAAPAMNVSDDADRIWMNDLIAIAESSASSPIYPLLKRD